MAGTRRQSLYSLGVVLALALTLGACDDGDSASGEAPYLEITGGGFVSQLDQDVNPEKPLTVGPGYHENPELDETGTKP